MQKAEGSNSERKEEAQKSLREMEKEIAPFVRPRKFEEHSTAGEWRDASEHERLSFFHDLRKASRRTK